MAAPTVTSYTSFSQIQPYAPGIDSSAGTQSLIGTLAAAASRFIDSVTGTWFYNEGPRTRGFNMISPTGEMQGAAQVSTMIPFFPSKIGTIASANKGVTSLTYTAIIGGAPVIGDIFTLDDWVSAEQVTVSNVAGGGPYTLTVGTTASAHATSTLAQTVITVQLAYFENQPLANILTLTGDGINPPSNFFLYPKNPRSYSAVVSGTAVTLYKPWWGFDLSHLPSPNTTFLPIAIGGYATAGINASWGWPAVPDVIADLATKAVVRAWKSVQAGHQITGGTPELGVVDMSRHFDEKDLEILASSEWVAYAI